jgi:biotin carboxyl carrier protein
VKYFVTVNGEDHEVELVERFGKLEVRLDGEAQDVRYEEVDRLGQAALYLGTRSYAVSIEGERDEVAVTVAGHLYVVAIEDERERAARGAERAEGRHGGDVKSVMPGIVVEVLVTEGQEVQKGEALLLLEAMKMQNEIAAPYAGRVRTVHVTRGQAVGNGALLVSLVAEGG